mgnify:CR=1 FL=1
MSNTRNYLYESNFGTSPKTQQDADDYASMMNVWSNTKDPEEFAQAERNINVEGRMDENPNAGMLKYTYAEADATGVAHDNIDAILTGNKLAQAYNLEEASNLGTIGPNPAYDDEGNLKFKGGYAGQGTPFSPLDLVGLGLMGRISKGAITGGHRMLQQIPKHIQNLLDTPGSPFIANPFTKELLKKGTKAGDRVGKEVMGLIKEDNKINSVRILMNKALKKWGIKPNERTVNDPVTELLRSQKGSRFSPHRKN